MVYSDSLFIFIIFQSSNYWHSKLSLVSIKEQHSSSEELDCYVKQIQRKLNVKIVIMNK